MFERSPLRTTRHGSDIRTVKRNWYGLRDRHDFHDNRKKTRVQPFRRWLKLVSC